MQHQTNRNMQLLQSEQPFQKHHGGRMEGSVEGQQLQDGQGMAQQPMAQQHMEQQHYAVATQRYVPVPVHISCIAQGLVQQLQECVARMCYKNVLQELRQLCKSCNKGHRSGEGTPPSATSRASEVRRYKALYAYGKSFFLNCHACGDAALHE